MASLIMILSDATAVVVPSPILPGSYEIIQPSNSRVFQSLLGGYDSFSSNDAAPDRSIRVGCLACTDYVLGWRLEGLPG